MIAIRSAAIFAAVYALAYVASVELNLAAFTYHPRPGVWNWGTTAPRSGPAMYYYGWIATAAAVGAIVTAMARPLAARMSVPLWIGWAVPLASILSFLWFLRMFFLR